MDPAPPAEAPPPRPAPKPRSRLARHRRQIAALVLLFVAVLWMSVALGSGSVWPAAIGGTLLAAAALIGLQDLGR